MRPNQRIRDYILEVPIGEGGMGVVWRARHAILSRTVAIKVLAQRLLADPHFRSRFIEEAKAQARLEHPRIVGVREFFTEDGTDFLVMPFVDGESLAALLARAAGPLPLETALNVSRDVLEALDHAHQKGIIHRDVKPSNILLDRDGRAHLMDFGIALMVGQERHTRTGSSIGTPEYMSPEQIRRPRDLDHRSDVYSMGCVLYEMVTGRTPFEPPGHEGDGDFAIKEGHLTRDPEPPTRRNPSLPAAVEVVILKALAKDPNSRFSGCGEYLRALERAGRSAPGAGPGSPEDDGEIRHRDRGWKSSNPAVDELDAAGFRPLDPTSRWFPENPSAEQIHEAEKRDLPVAIEHEKSGLALILVPGGSFWMGASATDDARERDHPHLLDYEKPRLFVRVRPFYLGAGPVTVAQWERGIAGTAGSSRASNRPVTGVSWEEVGRLLEKLGPSGLRLPSEAEWEFAARSGRAQRYWWGEEYEPGRAVCDEQEWGVKPLSSPAEVGRHAANPWGFFDQVGNVWEWCADAFRASLDGVPADGTPRPPNGDRPIWRSVRGGAWDRDPWFLRVSLRLGFGEAYKSAAVGFRCARGVPGE